MFWETFVRWLVDAKPWLEPLSYFATVIGVPILLFSYLTALVVEGHRREVGTYDTLETQYVEFQRQAIRYAKLDVADAPLATPAELSDEERVQQRTLYMVLFSLFERAYLMYRPWPPGPIGRVLMGGMRNRQWDGWVSYIDKYLRRGSCCAAWFGDQSPREDVGQDFDPGFERFIWKRLQKLKLV